MTVKRRGNQVGPDDSGRDRPGGCPTSGFVRTATSERAAAATRRAIAELEAGKGKRFTSVKALMNDLNADD